MRRYGLIFALIPAILAASIGLAYYSYTRTRTDRRLVIETMAELAREKVYGVESEIIKAEQEVFGAVEYDKKHELGTLLEGRPFSSAFLLDNNGKIVPGGTYVTGGKEARRFF
ncbi:MAG: hypothetical protein KJO07_18180, partial [Deltaproteobacteria bacterium]|nr:hypothetical protein [Deltaproteobacteria bacterium]